MTTGEYAQFILQVKTEKNIIKKIDEISVSEVAQLLSGSFTYLLHQALWVNYFDMDAITHHLESLYDSKNYFGLVYFIFILANAVEFTIPVEFTAMSAEDTSVVILSAAIIEDWLDYHTNSEATEYSG